MTRIPSAPKLLVATTLLAFAFAGCMGDAEATSLYASFEDALEAPGEVFPADSNLGEGAPMLKLLAPVQPAAATPGDLDLVFLLYDAAEDAPLVDGVDLVQVAPKDPATGDVEAVTAVSAVHDDYGVYTATVPLDPPGPWLLDVAVLTPSDVVPDGSVTTFGFVLALGGPGGGEDVPHAEGATYATRDPLVFASFGDALDAPGTLYRPLNAEEFATGHDFGEDVTAATYSKTYEFPVTSGAASRILVSAQLTSMFPATAVPIDTLTMRVDSPAGGTAGTIFVTNSAPQASGAFTSVAVPGTWKAVVTGRAVEASYTLHVVVEYEPVLKVLDPASPANATPGRQPFVFLLYDEFDGVPLTGGVVDLESRDAATSLAAQADEDPVETGNGTYTGYTDLATPGDWVVGITVDLDGLAFRYEAALVAADPAAPAEA